MTKQCEECLKEPSSVTSPNKEAGVFDGSEEFVDPAKKRTC